MENEIMSLITFGGDARSKAILALSKLKFNQFEEARTLLKECNEDILVAHKLQTKLLQQEAGGLEKTVSLLMVHAQDHLMDAMVVRDLVEQIIDLQEKNYLLIEELNKN